MQRSSCEHHTQSREVIFICTHGAGIPLARFSVVDANPATAAANFASPDFDLIGHYWTGTASTTDEVILITSYGGGANPPITAVLNHFGSPGGFFIDFSPAKTVKIKRVLGGGSTLAVADVA